MKKIKKGDVVVVLSGKDKGKESYVVEVLNKHNTVLVKDVNIVTKSRKPNQALGIVGGIEKFEKPIDMSNVMLVDSKTSKPVRVGFRFDESGKKVRFSKKSGNSIVAKKEESKSETKDIKKIKAKSKSN